jgi:5-methylcytosine-specific restriction endonuclease McrA
MGRTTIPYHCINCGNVYQAIQSEINRGKGMTCSRSCANEQRKAKQQGIARPLTEAALAVRETQAYKQKLSVAQTARWSDPTLYPQLLDAIQRRSKSRAWRNAAHQQRGQLNPRFRGVAERRRDDNRYAYRKWRTSVLRRDKMRCVDCGVQGPNGLQAHHLQHWKDAPELRFAVENGVTLCRACHLARHNPNTGSL